MTLTTPGPQPAGQPAGATAGAHAGGRARLAPAGTAPGGTAPGAPPPAGPALPGGWRRWRTPALIVALILLGGVVVAMLQAAPPPTGPLDPRDTGPEGTHALVALLTQRGQHVVRAGSAGAALSQPRGTGTTLVITSPWKLPSDVLASLGQVRSNLLLVAPDSRSLAAVAPAVTLAGPAAVGSEQPRCTLPAATLAGSADLGGALLRTSAPGAWRCYRAATPLPGADSPPSPAGTTLVRYRNGWRTITVLGSGAPLTNHDLGREGNAALALNLLDTGPQVIWLVPGPQAIPLNPGGQRPLTSLIPSAVYLVALELAVAVLLAALWRMRRFGPLVREPLPVVVRASETVEGHGRLYRSRRSRDRAAAALRAALISRVTARLGLPPDTAPDALAAELAGRTGRDIGEISALLSGPVPPDDAALVALATDLDSLEGQVLSQ